MRRTFVYCFFCIRLVLPFIVSAQVPFHQGVNLTNWFQTESARQIQFSKFTKKDFQNIKSLGCDVIRLPINLHAMTNGEPDFTLDPIFFTFLDQVVNWSDELDIHLILDYHTFDPVAATDPNIGPILVKVWTQMAAHYKDHSDHVYYEILNEPHGITDALWGSIQQSAIDAIRSQDTEHYIIVGPSNYNSYNSLSNLPIYTDTKLIYTFHFYDPFIFTHQGASWTDPSMVPLGGVPFPYRSTEMPSVPNSLKGTWIESLMSSYANDGTVAKVKQQLDIAVNFKNQRNVPVFCGEFGVYIPNSSNIDRVGWYNAVRNYLNEQEIPWTIWDYTGGFGLFNKNSNELFDYDLNVPLLEALAFESPEQKIYTKKPKTTGFILYDDFIGEGIFESSSTGDGILDYYSDDDPEAGAYCIYWTGVGQYDAIGFDFKPDLDLSLLPANEYLLEFWVKGNSPDARFDIRFVDTKSNNDDHPWRMGKTIDNTVAPWDGIWHHVALPLKEMEEKGSWDNAFFNPEGKFTWSAIDRFEIVPEHQPLQDIAFSFDDIRVSGEEITIVTGVNEIADSFNLKMYPNPLSDVIKLEYSSSRAENIGITIYSILGEKVKTIFSGHMLPGKHIETWDGSDNAGHAVANGMYLVRLESATGCYTGELLVSRNNR